MLSEVSHLTQTQKPHVFSHMWKIDPKINKCKNKHDHITNSEVEHVCNSGTALWNSGKERKEKRMIEYQQYHIPSYGM
jgi:hypothetical protein